MQSDRVVIKAFGNAVLLAKRWYVSAANAERGPQRSSLLDYQLSIRKSARVDFLIDSSRNEQFIALPPMCVPGFAGIALEVFCRDPAVPRRDDGLQWTSINKDIPISFSED